MLRYAAQHFEALRPYRWRLTRMLAMCKPPYTLEYKAIEAALASLDRAAERHLSPEEMSAFTAEWIPRDHA